MSETALAVTNDGEVIEGQALEAPVTLFGTNDPVAVVERASSVATALKDIIAKRDLTSRIQNKDHVQVEGWTLLGSMLGVFAEIEWSKPLDNGWEARAVARTLNGNVVGAADAMCTRSESSWRNRDDYALRSMAQTRAVSKALRMPLGFIMHLAGYSATPADEIADEQPGRGERTTSAEAQSPRAKGSAETRAPVGTKPKTKGEAQTAIAAAAHAKGLTFNHIEEKAKELGIARGNASMDDLLRLLAAIEDAHPAAAAA